MSEIIFVENKHYGKEATLKMDNGFIIMIDYYVALSIIEEEKRLKKYTVNYYLEATVSFSAEVEANSEEEAKAIAKENMGCEEHEEMDWNTNKYVFNGIQEEDSEEDDDEY